MNIREMRNQLDLSRAEFSRKYEIPIRTLESWESGVRIPPKYVMNLLERAVQEDFKSYLEEVLYDFFESCIRNGYYDMEENADYFVKENDHKILDREYVLKILKEIEDTYTEV